MPEVSGVARFSSKGPGKGKFTIDRFGSKLKDLGDYKNNGIEICVSKEF